MSAVVQFILQVQTVALGYLTSCQLLVYVGKNPLAIECTGKGKENILEALSPVQAERSLLAVEV